MHTSVNIIIFAKVTIIQANETFYNNIIDSDYGIHTDYGLQERQGKSAQSVLRGVDDPLRRPSVRPYPRIPLRTCVRARHVAARRADRGYHRRNRRAYVRQHAGSLRRFGTDARRRKQHILDAVRRRHVGADAGDRGAHDAASRRPLRQNTDERRSVRPHKACLRQAQQHRPYARPTAADGKGLRRLRSLGRTARRGGQGAVEAD